MLFDCCVVFSRCRYRYVMAVKRRIVSVDNKVTQVLTIIVRHWLGTRSKNLAGGKLKGGHTNTLIIIMWQRWKTLWGRAYLCSISRSIFTEKNEIFKMSLLQKLWYSQIIRNIYIYKISRYYIYILIIPISMYNMA